MSINWVMLSETDGFVRLPDELIVRVSPRRTSFLLQCGSTKKGKDEFCIESSQGTAYLTNQRIVYLPANPTPEFQSFSAPLLNIMDTHVAAPFFGPNVWNATIEPVARGGLPKMSSLPTLKLTFKDGGTFDFHTDFETIKERLLQIIEESGQSPHDVAVGLGRAGTGGAGAHLNYAAVNMDPLPAYEEGNGNGMGMNMPPMPYVQHAWTPAEAPAYDDSGAVTTMPVSSPPYTSTLEGREEARQGQQGPNEFLALSRIQKTDQSAPLFG
ncbi:hypothetical protein KEM56_001527 [Ascosphaera pollenicola]|nr:hypothetical protein KEM56_001527 [Ascosphaera pollenicola]